MKRLLLALTVGLLVSVSLGVSAASASHRKGEGPKHDSLTGRGHFFRTEIHFNAKSGPSGEDAQGRFSLERVGFTDLDVKGEVSYLRVTGNAAEVQGEGIGCTPYQLEGTRKVTTTTRHDQAA
jgi:hypothetical protein